VLNWSLFTLLVFFPLSLRGNAMQCIIYLFDWLMEATQLQCKRHSFILSYTTCSWLGTSTTYQSTKSNTYIHAYISTLAVHIWSMQWCMISLFMWCSSSSSGSDSAGWLHICMIDQREMHETDYQERCRFWTNQRSDHHYHWRGRAWKNEANNTLIVSYYTTLHTSSTHGPLFAAKL
jgi:hypothetical protein